MCRTSVVAGRRRGAIDRALEFIRKHTDARAVHSAEWTNRQQTIRTTQPL
jgi:hypothetical protein